MIYSPPEMKKTGKTAISVYVSKRFIEKMNIFNPVNDPLMKKKFVVVMVFIFVTAAWFTSCKKDKALPLTPPAFDLCDTIIYRFSNDIHPIFTQYCTDVGCHVTGNPSGNLRYETHAEIADPAGQARLLGAINHKPGFSPMPQNLPQIPDSLRVRINCWFNNGAPNN